MEVLYNQCEVEMCDRPAHRERVVDGQSFMYCFWHNGESDEGKDANILTVNQQEIALTHIKNTIRNLKLYKYHMVQMLEKLAGIIKAKSTSILYDISQKQRKIKILMNQILEDRKIFSKTYKNLEKYSNVLIDTKNFDFSILATQINDHFNKDFICPSENQPVAELQTKNTSNSIPFTFLSNYKLTQPQTPITKKLKILTKTDFFMNIASKGADFELNPLDCINSKLNSVESLLFSIKYNILITAHLGNLVKFWRLPDFSEIRTDTPVEIVKTNNKDINESILEMGLINDDTLLVVGNIYIKIINLETITSGNLHFHNLGVFYICKVFPDNSKILMGNYDGVVILFDIKTLSKEREVRVRQSKPTKTLTNISVSLNYTCALIGDCDGKIYIWRLKGDSNFVSFHQHTKSVLLSCFAGSQFFATYSDDGIVKIWNIFPEFEVTHKFKAGKGCLAMKFFEGLPRNDLALIILGEKKTFFFKIEKKIKAVELQDSRLIKLD